MPEHMFPRIVKAIEWVEPKVEETEGISDLDARRLQIENARQAIEAVRPDLVKDKAVETEEDVSDILKSKELTEKDQADIDAKAELNAALKLDMVDEAISFLHEAMDSKFGPEAWDSTSPGYPLAEAEKQSEDPQVQSQVMDTFNIQFLRDEVFPELSAIFSAWPAAKHRKATSPMDVCDKFLHIKTKSGGKTVEVERANIRGLISFLYNLSSALSGSPMNAYRVPSMGKATSPGSDVPYAGEVTEQLKTELQRKVEEESSYADYNKAALKATLEAASLSEKEISEILEGADLAVANMKSWAEIARQNKAPVKKEVQQIVDKGVSATMHTKASYKVVKGQEVTDPIYGKGKVIGLDNLENGFVSVAFGPTVVIDQYDAGQIVQPVIENIPTFECPMDKTIIAADLCMGEVPQDACRFLQFINNTPSCGFNSACQKQHDEACDCKNKKVLEQDQAQEKFASKLNEILKDASFSDHDYFQITEYVPVDVNGLVKKKSANLYGKVIERCADSSLTVRWNNGTETLAWESELQGIDGETGLKLKTAGII